MLRFSVMLVDVQCFLWTRFLSIRSFEYLTRTAMEALTLRCSLHKTFWENPDQQTIEGVHASHRHDSIRVSGGEASMGFQDVWQGGEIFGLLKIGHFGKASGQLDMNFRTILEPLRWQSLLRSLGLSMRWRCMPNMDENIKESIKHPHWPFFNIGTKYLPDWSNGPLNICL